MQVLQEYLWQIFHFFTGNLVAGGILVVIVIFLAIKKPKMLFQIGLAIVGVIALLYVLVFLESAMFSGHSDKGSVYEVEKRTGG